MRYYSGKVGQVKEKKNKYVEYLNEIVNKCNENDNNNEKMKRKCNIL